MTPELQAAQQDMDYQFFLAQLFGEKESQYRVGEGVSVFLSGYQWRGNMFVTEMRQQPVP